jgi:hypothetical protein
MITPTTHDNGLEQAQIPAPTPGQTDVTPTNPVAPTAEPEVTAVVPARPERRRNHPRLTRALRAIRTFIVVVALLAGAAAGGAYVVRQRQAASAFVELGGAVLTADAVPVGSPDAGLVTDVMVTDQSHVAAGQDLAKVTLTASGTGKQQVQVLHAPTAGTVSAVNVAVGGVAKPGEPIVTLYDEGELTFQADVAVKDLRRLRVGMTASITGPGLGRRISATLDHVVPKVGGDPLATADRLTVVLVPAANDIATVRTLVPGLRFRTIVDTKTAADGTPAVNSAR